MHGVLTLLLVLAIGVPARADGFLHDLADDVRARLAPPKPPELHPPKPIKVKWQAVKIDSIDLHAPIAAVAAADLDGDGKAELYAVTSREVVALSLRTGRVKELGRVAFAGDPAVPASRDVVGVATVDGRVLDATVSTFARGLRVSWRGKALVADPADPGFLLCPGERVALVRGRDYFQGLIYGERCHDLVDATGAPLPVRAALSTTNRLGVSTGDMQHELKDVGVAFEVADVDQDGTPEVIYSEAVAPGDSDTVRVVTVGGTQRLKKPFKGTGVAGVAVGDLDGDGKQDVIVVARLYGSTWVDLWRLD